MCARCPVRGLTAERHARVAHLGRVFHQVGPCELLDTTPDLIACLRAALEIRDQLRPRLVQVGFVDNAVAIKDGARLVSGQDHGDAFRDPRADQIARRRPPAIMQEPARDPRLATRPRPRAPPRPHRRLIPREHPEVPGAPPQSCPPTPRQLAVTEEVNP